MINIQVSGHGEDLFLDLECRRWDNLRESIERVKGGVEFEMKLNYSC